MNKIYDVWKEWKVEEFEDFYYVNICQFSSP